MSVQHKCQILALMTVLWMMGGAAAPLRAEPRNETKGHPSRHPVAPWETRSDAWYEHHGVAMIEKAGDRYLLTIDCAGIHSVYATGSHGVHLDRYLGAFVRVRYVYTTVVNPNTRCIQAPCNPALETIAVIAQVEPLTRVEATRMRARPPCTP